MKKVNYRGIIRYLIILNLLIIGSVIIDSIFLNGKGCSKIVEQTEDILISCPGYMAEHPLYIWRDSFSRVELSKFYLEDSIPRRVDMMVIRFALKPMESNGKTVIEHLSSLSNIPGAISLAQAIHEPAIKRQSGVSTLALKYKNWHGIKARKGLKNVSLLTHEYRKGIRQNEYAKFSVFETDYDSFATNIKILSSSKAYQSLQNELVTYQEYKCMHPDRRLEYLRYILLDKKVLSPYATSPVYADTIYKIIVEYNLHLIP